MAWEKRASGHQYFYLCKRSPDGRVHKQYFGKGPRAEVESMRLDFKVREREQEKIRRSKFESLDSLADECMKAFMQLFEAHLYAAGYHNPKSRGWRKRRSVQMIKQMECEQRKQEDTEPESGEGVSEEEISLGELIRRCRAGDEEARMTLREFMQENPDLFSRLGHITAKVQAEWVRAISGPDLFEREMMLKRASELRKGLLDEGSGSHLERLVVDQVLTTHLEQGFHQLIEARCVGKGVNLPKYQVEASQRASKRHEKALAALTTIRAIKFQQTAIDPIRPAEPPKESSEADIRTPTHLGANRISGAFDKQHQELLTK